jgi:hypothetical protein
MEGRALNHVADHCAKRRWFGRIEGARERCRANG